MEDEPEKKAGEEPERFKPCVGDIVMRGYAPEGAEYTPSCGVVLHVFEDELGDRLYFVQMNRALILAKGPERLTQKELDRLRLHPATKAEWQKNMGEVEEWYAGEKAALYKAIEPFLISSDGN